MNYKQFVNWKARSFKDPFVKLERDFCEILEGLRQDFTRGFCSTHEFCKCRGAGDGAYNLG